MRYAFPVTLQPTTLPKNKHKRPRDVSPSGGLVIPREGNDVRKPTQVRPSRRNYRNATGGYGRWTALNSLGPVVYAMQLDDGVVKIGFTTDLAAREKTVRKQSGSQTCDLLAFQPGTHEDEQAIHAALVAHLHHGREYYHPVPEVLARVNGMRSALNLPPLAA